MYIACVYRMFKNPVRNESQKFDLKNNQIADSRPEYRGKLDLSGTLENPDLNARHVIINCRSVTVRTVSLGLWCLRLCERNNMGKKNQERRTRSPRRRIRKYTKTNARSMFAAAAGENRARLPAVYYTVDASRS